MLEGVDKSLFRNRIQSIETRSKELAKYGFIPEFSGKEILNNIESADSLQIGFVAQVLTPYLESLERRLKALNELYAVVDNFINTINGFLSYKKIDFNVHEGLEIITKIGNVLTASHLSSGERHLLLIFCNTILSSDNPSIFIIDEPEISLNIKWQRDLISSLSKCIGDKPVQIILATHSLEIISQYRDRVFKLESLKNED